MLSLSFLYRSLIVLVCGVTLASLAAVAQAVEYGGVGGRPANPKSDNPRTESIFIHTLNPGSTVEDGVRVLNNTAERKTLLVSAVDSASSSGGAFACAQGADTKTGVGAWITLTKTEVTLDSLTNEVVPFTLTVPQNASVGEHNGCIVIQEKKEASGESGIQLSFRTGLRVAVLVPGAVSRNLEITSFDIQKKDSGNVLLHPVVKNSGNVSIDTQVTVTTSYFFGKKVAEHGGQFPVLRGQASEWNFELKRPFWGGWYKSVLSASFDSDPEATVGKPSGKPLTVLMSEPVWYFVMPSVGALIIELGVVLLLLAMIGWIIARRKRQNRIRKTWIAYTVQTGDTLQGLARAHGISWKLLARVNNIAPPYTLEVGQKLKVPPSA